MKKTKQLIAAALIPALMPFSTYAQDAIAASPVVAEDKGSESKSLSEKAGDLKDKLWETANKRLKKAKIRKQLSLPTMELAKGLNLGGSYKIESSRSIAEKYSGIDVWEVNLAAYPELFGASLPGGIGAGLSMAREVTYIQQFKTQKESLLRVPYDPVTKLPLNSKIFFKKSKNIFTGKEEMTLKPGDFIAYRAPMTFSLGRGFSQIAASHLGLSGGLYYAISGEFDVHIFVMDNNLIRVKILAIKSKSKGVYAGVSLLGFDGIGRTIINKLVDGNILELYFNKSKTDLFIADYIFNMNKEEPQELYNKVIGSKLHVFSLESIKQQVLTANPFASDGNTRDRLIANLDDLNDMSAEDQNKPYDERRIFKLLNAHNESETVSQGLKLNLFKILKFQESVSKTGSKITIYANNDDSVKAKFKLDSYSLANSFEILPSLNIWGDKLNTSNSLLTQTDMSNNPIGFIGLQNTKIREDFTLKKTELEGLLNRLQKILPASIYNNLEKPNWNFNSKNAVKDVRIQQDITFNSDLFKMKSEVKEEAIRTALFDILENYGKLKSRPIGAKQAYEADQSDFAMEAYKKGDYAEAYGYSVEKLFGGQKRVSIDNEMLLIPQKLSVALDSRYSFEERYAEFTYLYEKVPLFSEISNVLLLKLLPTSALERLVLVRISMSAKGQSTLITDYPTTEAFNTSNLFREILGQNGYMNDRSYNLRHYLKEDGTQYSVNEIMIEKK